MIAAQLVHDDLPMWESAVRFGRLAAATALVRAWKQGVAGRADDPATGEALVGLANDGDVRLPRLCAARDAAADDLDAALGSRFARLASLLELSAIERHALVLLVVGELDPRTRAMLRRLRSDADPSPLCRAVLAQVLCGDDEPWQRPEVFATLFDESGVLTNPALVSAGGGTFAHRALAATPRTIRAVTDRPIDVPTSPRPVVEEALDANVIAKIRELVAENVFDVVLVVSGAAGAGRRTHVEVALRSVEPTRRAFHFRLGALARWQPEALAEALTGAVIDAHVDGAILVIDYETGDLPERLVEVVSNALKASREMIVFISNTSRVALPLERAFIHVAIEAPVESARRLLWSHALTFAQTTPDAVDRIAGAYRVGPALTMRAARNAMLGGAVERENVDAGRLARAVAAELDSDLGTLGHRIVARQSWSDLVLPDDTLTRVEELMARIQRRRQVFEDWGFGRKFGAEPGFVGLFSGESGVGKTMVATLIAQELGFELYRVDLAQIVSKWVGETEKNLGRVFDAAEQAQAVLLFDEADSLFGKRTEVKSSVDRYANLEVNYLLQRLDEFSGIALLTTNRGDSLDSALDRRIGYKLRFPMPDEIVRAELWRRMMPKAAPVASDIDFHTLAQHRMSGGVIRNAVIRAAFLAATRHESIAMTHLELAIALEFEDAGHLHT